MVDYTRRGCLKKFAAFLVILAIIILISSILIYKQSEDIKRWWVSKAIDSASKNALNQRPDGISEKEIKQTFEQLKYANKNNQVDWNKLYHILKKYQLQKSPPSYEETIRFLEGLRTTIKK